MDLTTITLHDPVNLSLANSTYGINPHLIKDITQSMGQTGHDKFWERMQRDYLEAASIIQ